MTVTQQDRQDAEIERQQRVIIRLHKEIEQLKATLRRYGAHTWECRREQSTFIKSCSCGWIEAHAALKTKS